MILNLVLLTAGRIIHDAPSKLNIAIVPQIQITSENGIQVKNPLSGYEIWLTGIVDYGVAQYKDELNVGCKHLVISYNL
jgi:hypothetical protein